MIVIRRCCCVAICHSREGDLVTPRAIIVPVREPELLSGGEILLLILFGDVWSFRETPSHISDLTEQSLLLPQKINASLSFLGRLTYLQHGEVRSVPG